jgi:hypothetical protein
MKQISQNGWEPMSLFYILISSFSRIVVIKFDFTLNSLVEFKKTLTLRANSLNSGSQNVVHRQPSFNKTWECVGGADSQTQS